MKTIIVDDEIWAVEQLEASFKNKNGIELVGSFRDPLEAMRYAESNCVDFALLDEPSSALDPIAEYKMYESLIEATKDKTVIYISHRLSSAVLSDKIYVFEDGRVSECGTHEQLMAAQKGYCEMFTLQASSYKNEEGSVN